MAAPTLDSLLEAERQMLQFVLNEATHLHMVWQNYDQLFGEADDRELLAWSAKDFFVVVERSFRYDLSIGVCRLLHDPAEHGSNNAKRNLSLEGVIAGLEHLLPERLFVNLRSELKSARDASKPIKEWRNKKGGHSDCDTALGINALEAVDRRMIESTLSSITVILNEIYQTIDGSVYRVDAPWMIGPARDLVGLLRRHRESIYPDYPE